MPRITQIYRVILYQAGFAAALVPIFYVMGSLSAAASVLAGGCIGVAGNAVLAIRMVASRPAGPSGWLLGFYVGEVFKLLLAALLFFTAIVVCKAELLPLLAGFVATVVANWFALIWITPINKRRKHGARAQ